MNLIFCLHLSVYKKPQSTSDPSLKMYSEKYLSYSNQKYFSEYTSECILF